MRVFYLGTDSHGESRFVGMHLTGSQLLDSLGYSLGGLALRGARVQAGAQFRVRTSLLDRRGDDSRELLPRLVAGCLVTLHKNEGDVPMAGITRLDPDLAHALPVDREVQPLPAPRVRHKRSWSGRLGVMPRQQQSGYGLIQPRHPAELSTLHSDAAIQIRNSTVLQ
jgi:hypothetical protein